MSSPLTSGSCVLVQRLARMDFVDSPGVKQIPDGHEFSMRLRVTDAMTATFFASTIHRVYATFAIVEHAEYAARQAILPFLEPNEDAVGSMINLWHTAPAPVGAVVELRARVTSIEDRTINCEVEALWRGQSLAHGTQQQRVVSKERMQQRVADLYRDSTIPDSK